LYQFNPSEYGEGMSLCLGNVAGYLIYEQKHRQSIPHLKQSIELAEKLHQRDGSDKNTLGYANLLNNYSELLSELGDLEQGIQFGEQALIFFRSLAKKKPELYESNYANGLECEVRRLQHMGMYTQALDASENVLLMYQRLALAGNKCFSGEIADIWRTKTQCLLALSQFTEGCASNEKAFEVTGTQYQQLPKELGQRYAKRLQLQQYACWLAGSPLTGFDKNLLEKPENQDIFDEQLDCKLQQAYLSGLYEPEQTLLSFYQVVQIAMKMNEVDRRKSEQSWLVAGLYLQQQLLNLEHSAIADLGITLDEDTVAFIADCAQCWKDYKQQRHDNIPKDIELTAQRLGVVLG
jgi:hypothetical protein